MATKKKQWVDEVDEEEAIPTQSVQVKSSGSKSYTFHIRVPNRVLARRNLPTFGEGSDDHENVTAVSKELIPMEHPDDQFNEETEDPSLKSTLASFLQKQQERSIQRELGIEEEERVAETEVPAEKETTKSDKYVPPGRLAAGGRDSSNAFDQEQNSIRVSNLTKAVTEQDIYDLFEPFGKILRVSLPRNAETRELRGFAFVTFHEKRSAELAMTRLQGHGYDHLILKLEWAKPSKEGGGSSGGGLSGGYVSGYGKQLAQDTKEQVVYASNLTGNR